MTQSVTYSSIPLRVRLPLRGHDDGDTALFQPARQPAQLRPHDRVVAERAEQHLDGVQHDPPGANTPDRVIEDDKERFEIELPRRDDLGRVHPEREHHELAVLAELVEVEAERAHVQGYLGL
jgi:hypothetical protein